MCKSCKFARKIRVGDKVAIKPTIAEVHHRLSQTLVHIEGTVYARNGKFYNIVCNDGNELTLRRAQLELNPENIKLV